MQPSTSPIRIIVLAIVATIALIASGAFLAACSEEPGIVLSAQSCVAPTTSIERQFCAGLESHWTRVAQAQAETPPHVYVLLAAWYTPSDERVTSMEPRQFSSLERCESALEVLRSALQGRTEGAMAGCGVLPVPADHLAKVLAWEAQHQAPTREQRAPAPASRGDGLTL